MIVQIRTKVLNDEWHCANGPARIWNTGRSHWYLFGKRHRYYGTAGMMSTTWYIHGNKVK
jgi:hypothetical protein